jgi:CHAT domain-containing protein/Flp pilus assembly protein TadD
MFFVSKDFTHLVRVTFLVVFLTFFSGFHLYSQTLVTSDIRPLPMNQTIEREIKAAEEHFYTIKLKAGEVLRLQLEEGQEVNYIFRLINADSGETIIDADLTSIFGREEITYIAQTKKSLKVLVKPTAIKSSRYKLTTVITQKVISKDKERLRAEKLSREAKTLPENHVILPNTYENRRKAVGLLEEVLAIRRKHRDKYWESWTLNFLANINKALGNNQKALDYYNQALQIIPDDNKIAKTTVLLESAAIYTNLNESPKAINYYNKALEIFRQLKAREDEAFTLKNLGLNYSLLEQNEKAKDFYEQALIIYKELKNRTLEAQVFRELALVYYKLPQFEKKLSFYEQFLAISREIRDENSEGEALNYLALIYDKNHQYEKARDYYEQGLIVWRNIQGINRASNSRPIAHPKISKFSVENRLRVRYKEATTLKNLMILYERLKDKNISIIYGKQAVNVLQEIRKVNFLKPTLDKKSQELFLDIHEPTYRFLAALLVEENRFLETPFVLDLLKVEEFKQIVRRNGEPLFTLPYTKTEEEAIKIVDRLATLGRELSELKAKPKDALSSAETKRLSEIESIEIPAANKALRQATEALSTVAPDVKNAIDLKMKDNIQNILPDLGKGVVALYTVIGKTSADENDSDKTGNKTDNNKTNVGWILLVTPEIRKAYPIDTINLEQTVFRLREALRSPVYDPQPVAAELYKKLFQQTSPKQTRTLEQDLRETLGQYKDKTLMWSLDGVLRYVPIAALHDGESYLVEKYRNVVFNTASLGSLKDAVKPNWEVAGLGVSTEGTVKAYDGRELSFAALKGSEAELNSIVKEKNKTDDEGVFSGTLKINKDFTKEALFEGARAGMPVMHISSHFWFNPAQEETSFLLLGGGGRLEVTEFQDYPNLFANVDFLSLSACDTATGGTSKTATAAETEEKARASNGKEIEGFAYIAQTLGAKSVMASLWQVSDTGTKELMLKFYEIKKQQPELPKGEALRQAQLSLLKGTIKAPESDSEEKRLLELIQEKGQKGVETINLYKRDEKTPFAHPYYWSHFILIGNWL